MARGLGPSFRSALSRLESHLWVCSECGSEPSIRGTIDVPQMICPIHPEAELVMRGKR